MAGSARSARRSQGRLVPLLKWALVAAIWAGVALAAVIGWYAWDLPDVDRVMATSRRPSVTVASGDGAVVATYGEIYGGTVTLADAPPFLVQAIVATEDRRFFSHGGLDPFGVVRAAAENLRAGSIRQGGSTITQQLAKNLFLTPARTMRRKVQESLLALWLEARFTKEQIFTIYLNRVYLGGGSYGFQAASRRYFGRDLDEINLHEAALLAGLLKAPSRYAPSQDREAARTRAEQVLANMVDAGFIGERDAQVAARQPLRIARSPAGQDVRYFADWALERVSGFVGAPDRDLVVVSTLDARLQRLAEAALDRTLERDGKRLGVAQGALVALSPDGAVRAMVGGRSYAQSQYNRAAQALRQPGSAFKLFVYLAALENGLTPSSRVVDGPISIDKWRPRNFEGRYRGAVTLTEAFAQSINTVAADTAERVGRRNVIAVARRLGITSKLESHPSLALGASEVTLVELTAAYAAVANGGYAVNPYAIAEIRDRAARALYRPQGSSAPRVLDAQIVRSMDDMLSAVLTVGTGRAARFAAARGGKTGTSQEFRDAWFVGYAGDMVAGVWVGNDDGAAMKGVTGGNLPARIWRDFMETAFQGEGPRGVAAPVAGPARRPGGAAPVRFEDGRTD
jgi:penicillin-binding protein 1A